MSSPEKNIELIEQVDLKDKIHTVRGVQVMLDFELAEIYGYETKNFNRQVKNNIERFEGEDFRFQLTKEEFENLRCKNFTSSWGGTRYLPIAFTEQGIYMLMTVLKGPLAVEQSRRLIRLFKQMKDYISENRVFLGKGGYNNLVLAVNQNTRNIKTLQETMLTKADLPVFIELFDQQASGEEALILDGQPLKADVAYQRIYRKAKDSLVVVDDYIGVKTLQHIAHAKRTVSLTVVSDNRGRHPLRKNEYDDFRLEYKNRNIDFVQSKNKVHDRYILIDNSVVYHCGTSSKDAGNKVTTITRLQDGGSTISMIRQMLKHPKLTLR